MVYNAYFLHSFHFRVTFLPIAFTELLSIIMHTFHTLHKLHTLHSLYTTLLPIAYSETMHTLHVPSSENIDPDNPFSSPLCYIHRRWHFLGLLAICVEMKALEN